jgi:AraC-like DNA-binding protein
MLGNLDHRESVPRPVVAVSTDYPSAHELPEHRHRRAQFLYAARGVMVVNTPDGSWVAPPERGIWIPGGTPHSVRMVGAVRTHSVLLDPGSCRRKGSGCQVVGVSPLLRQLLVTASVLPEEYEEDGRDGLVMKLLMAEVSIAPLVPLAVPFPRHSSLARQCHAFMENPQASATIDAWAGALAMNRRSFTRLFRQETGMSFAQWRQQACIAAALPRLAEGDAITAIALDLGYEGPGNFTTMFRRILGVAPSHYALRQL